VDGREAGRLKGGLIRLRIEKKKKGLPIEEKQKIDRGRGKRSEKGIII